MKPNLKVLTIRLVLKNAVYLQNHGSCPFLVDTSCIWPQMRPWSILSCTASLHQKMPIVMGLNQCGENYVTKQNQVKYNLK